jgi:hypothetical protein
VSFDVPCFGQGFQMIFDRVAVCAGHLRRLADGDAPVLAAQLQNLYRELGQVTEDPTLALNLLL